MIDDLVTATDAITETVFTVRSGHLFVEEGHFTEPGLIENMAQTAAAGTGYKAMQANEQPPVGFIGAVKNLQIKSLPAIGDTISTSVVFVTQVMNAHIVQAEIKLHEKVIAGAEFKIFLQ
jgi:predicted hotdog family 3-hydroxylacyl-ACP dehydratase